MSRINILDDSTINKIAAGEVIERPASIVKELIENSIDASSSYISIEIENGGKDLIKIVDNGRGIPHDDVNKAFMRHATSKIQRVEDLNTLNSLGFRGEALASIAAVSKVRMITKTADELTATEIIINGGNINSKSPTSGNTGTQLIVSSLFYNTPARRKFLKSNQAETMAITDLINKLAIGNPSVRFKYINNKKTIFETTGDGSTINAIRVIQGRDIVDNLIEISYKSPYFSVSGYIANNNVYRSNRNFEYIYTNGRYIKSSNLMNIINESYKAIIPINKYPVYFLNFEINPSKIDVNIHPSKLEVKFDEETAILNEIGDYIRGMLIKKSLIGRYTPNKKLYDEDSSMKHFSSFTYENNSSFATKRNILDDKLENKMNDEVNYKVDDEVNYKVDDKASCKIDNRAEFPASYDINKKIADKVDCNIPKKDIGSIDNNIPKNDIYSTNNVSLKKDVSIVGSSSHNEVDYFSSGVANKAVADTTVENKSFFDDEEQDSRLNDFKNLNIIGIIFDTYIIFQRGGEMILMDQHAAHERVRFEMYMKAFRESSVNTQLLIDPIIMELSVNDIDIVRTNIDSFQKFGFIVEEYGLRNIRILGVPNTFGIPESEKFIFEIIDNIEKIENPYDSKYDDIAEIACKSAIKANDKISYNEARELVSQLEKCENPYTCPHGRPIMTKVTKYEIEKMFKRKNA
ncbi:DNA mismatch repair endonuclease MutL [Peptostreptococcus sp. D1]|uniref:DNA mismatch repair endonuclease MutL n=1 Tax=Peptostreptococcus sp. D1 TaxID=72304 RepID=UPI0008ED8C9E|nr:DNA mismatch repair endonuclease MutL [Peptostreptococcus sp. D1]SFE45152.1 DNA mismatch repair protein MutL [Peptostreptococcus sp. D1]